MITGITMGDPSGVGPEILLKALVDKEKKNKPFVVFGGISVLEKSLKETGVDLENRLRIVSYPEEISLLPGAVNLVDCGTLEANNLKIGEASAESGQAAYDAVDTAIKWAMEGAVDAVCTCPLNKEALKMAGIPFPGHTEIFSSLTKADKKAMLLFSEKLSVIHVTTHISLKDALERLSKNRILDAIELANEVMGTILGRVPKIAVAGVNPHAGENGLFGREEIEIIAPAVQSARLRNIEVEGPVSPDTVFFRAANGEWDTVVAMYHDQGHIPMKILDFHGGVNITAGLPIVRTSVDHGTAFDIAWQNKANPQSLLKALDIAEILAARKIQTETTEK